MPLVVGTEWSNNLFSRAFKGQIDEVKVWRGVRTENQIKKDMEPFLQSEKEGLLLYWNFNERTGNVVNDLSGANNHGLLNNFSEGSWVIHYYSIPSHARGA